MKTENHVSYEQAIKLKELGYDEQCRAFYWTADGQLKETDQKVHANNPNCTTMVAAPHVWDVMRWLREKQKLHIQVRVNGIRSMFWFEIWELKSNGYVSVHNPLHDTFESALSAGIDKALELLIKEKGNETE